MSFLDNREYDFYMENEEYGDVRTMDIISDDLEEAIDHGILVSKLAFLLSKTLEKDEKFCYLLAEAGLVHDIGKLKLGEYLYGRKKDSLNIEELRYIRMHPSLGYDILSSCGYDDIVVKGVYHHHENYDGTGYPDNLKGKEIPDAGRILRICDVFAALVSQRRYRSAFDIDMAIELMIDEIKNFDIEIFLAFLQMVHTNEMKEIIEFIESINKKYSYFREKSL